MIHDAPAGVVDVHYGAQGRATAALVPFRTATHAVKVLRGQATKPLYVTTAGGLDVDAAAQIVATMAGPHRLPSAIRRVDQLARGTTEPRSQ